MKKTIPLLMLTLLILGCCGIIWPGTKDEFEMIPKTANAVVILRPSSILGDTDLTPLFGSEVDYEIGQIERNTGIDLSKMDRLLIFLKFDSFTQQDAAYYGFIAKGTIDKDKILENIREDNTVSELDYHNRVMYRISPVEMSANESYLSFIGGDVLVSGSKEAVEDSIDVEAGNADSITGRQNLTAVYSEIGKDPIFVFLVESSPAIKREISTMGDQAPESLNLQVLSEVESLGLSIGKTGKNIEIRMIALTTDSTSAGLIVRVLEKAVSTARNMSQSGTSVRTLLAKISIKTDKNEVSVSLSPTLDELETAYDELFTNVGITSSGWYACNDVSSSPCDAYQEVYCDKFNPMDIDVREAAAEAISKHPGSYSANQILDIYDWVHQNIRYQNVPVNLTYEPYSPAETLRTKSGDCKNQAVLIASMIEAIGGSARVLIIPECQHAFAEVYIGGNSTKNRFVNVTFAHYSTAPEVHWHTSKNDTEIWFPLDTAGGSYPGNTIEDCWNVSQTFVLYNCNLNGWDWKAPDVTWMEYGPFKLYDKSEVIEPDTWIYFTYSVNTSKYDYCVYNIKLTSKARLFDWYVIPASDYYNFRNGYSYHYYYREEQLADTEYNFTMTKPDNFNVIIKNSNDYYPMTVVITINERCYKK